MSQSKPEMSGNTAPAASQVPWEVGLNQKREDKHPLIQESNSLNTLSLKRQYMRYSRKWWNMVLQPLLDPRCSKEVGKTDSSIFLDNRIINHSIEDCFTLKGKIQYLIENPFMSLPLESLRAPPFEVTTSKPLIQQSRKDDLLVRNPSPPVTLEGYMLEE